jgi:hypothetical protein
MFKKIRILYSELPEHEMDSPQGVVAYVPLYSELPEHEMDSPQGVVAYVPYHPLWRIHFMFRKFRI